ncbi:MAG: DUF2335 domain-containing protein [Treponema sp.]|nr:DUF2335 domain-containing protein [Treponema sp.]
MPRSSSIVKTEETKKSVMSAKFLAAHYSSPLPPAAELERYEKIYPGFAERLMVRYEKQSDHRMELETKVIESGIKNSARGQVFAFLLSAMTIGVGAFLIYRNKDILGIAAVLSALATLLGVFIYGNKSKKDERIQKSKANPEI